MKHKVPPVPLLLVLGVTDPLAGLLGYGDEDDLVGDDL